MESYSSVGTDTRSPAVSESLQKAVQFLLSRQRPDGHWSGEVEGDSILESEYILLMKILGDKDEERLRKAAEYVRRKALPDGGWAIFEGGPPELNASVKAYWTLKMTGTSADDPLMQKTREVILEMGGAGMCNSYTKFYLAALGQIPWGQAPAVPPELVLLPKWFYFNLYEISSWSRGFVVPLSIIWSSKPATELPQGQDIQELFVRGKSGFPNVGLVSWKRFFLIVDAIIKAFEWRGIHPWRRQALKAAGEWMLERFEKSAGLGAIYPPMVYALIALKCMGYPDDDPQVVRARRELENLGIEDEETLRFQPCTSPVWDTGIAVNALAAAGLSQDSPELVRAAEWMLSKQTKDWGDWKVKRPDLEPGGWYFEYANEFYPDIDDTAMVLLALRRVCTEHHSRCAKAVRKGIDWLLGMQGRDGGWASFDVDNNRKLFCSIPFADHNAIIDPSTADITARILEMLASYGYDRSDVQVKKAIDYLLKEQEPDGCWFGRWGVNYIYGTWQALKGLIAIGFSRDHQSIVLGAEWLLAHQNPDGGWGEGILSYYEPSQRGKGKSTASQTSWAVMGLMVAGHVDSPAVYKGIEYLVKTQNPDGSWDEELWTGTGFPKVFYLRYHLYRNSFPVWALGMYNRLQQNPGSDLRDPTSGGLTA